MEIEAGEAGWRRVLLGVAGGGGGALGRYFPTEV